MKLMFVTVFVLLACGAMGSFKKDTFKAHRDYRGMHGLKKLKWDDEVAKFAQNWCDYLAENDKFAHSKDSGYGENIYKSWGSPSDEAGKKAVKSWYDEVDDYDFSNPGFSMKTGHFTQVTEYSLIMNKLTIPDTKVYLM